MNRALAYALLIVLYVLAVGAGLVLWASVTRQMYALAGWTSSKQDILLSAIALIACLAGAAVTHAILARQHSQKP